MRPAAAPLHRSHCCACRSPASINASAIVAIAWSYHACAPLDAFDPTTGVATLARDASSSGTPPSFQLLAAAPLSRNWDELPPRERSRAGSGLHAATMGCYVRNGTVFTAGTTDWAQALSQDACVARITRNVMDRLAS